MGGAFCLSDSPAKTLPLVFTYVPDHKRKECYERSRSGVEFKILHSEEADHDKCGTLLKLFVAITRNDHLVCGLFFRCEGTNFSVHERFLVLGVFFMTIIGATTLIYGTGINENLSNLIVWILVVAAGAMLISQVFQWLFEYSTRLVREEQPPNTWSNMRKRSHDRRELDASSSESEMMDQGYYAPVQYEGPMYEGDVIYNDRPIHKRPIRYEQSMQERRERPVQYYADGSVHDGPAGRYEQHLPPSGYAPQSTDDHDGQMPVDYVDGYWSQTSTSRQPHQAMYQEEEDSYEEPPHEMYQEEEDYYEPPHREIYQEEEDNYEPPHEIYQEEEDYFESESPPEEVDGGEIFQIGEHVYYKQGAQMLEGVVQQKISEDSYKLTNGKLISRFLMNKIEYEDENPHRYRSDSTEEDESQDERYEQDDDEEEYYDDDLSPAQHPQPAHGMLDRRQYVPREVREEEWSGTSYDSQTVSDDTQVYVTPNRGVAMGAPTPASVPPKPKPDILNEPRKAKHALKLKRSLSAPTPGYGYGRQLPSIDERRVQIRRRYDYAQSEEETPSESIHVTRGEHYGRPYGNNREEYYRNTYPQQRYTDDERYERYDEEKYVTTGSPYQYRRVVNNRVRPPPFFNQRFYDDEDEDDMDSEFDQITSEDETPSTEEGHYRERYYDDHYEYDERGHPHRDSRGMDDRYGQPRPGMVTAGYHDIADEDSFYDRRNSEYEQQKQEFNEQNDFTQRKMISDQNYFLPMWTRSCAWIFGLVWLLTALLCTAYYAGGLETTQIVEATALTDDPCDNPEEFAWIYEASKIVAHNSPENGVTKSQRTNWVLFIIAAAVVGLLAFSPAIFFLEALTSVLSLGNPSAVLEAKYEVFYFLKDAQ